MPPRSQTAVLVLNEAETKKIKARRVKKLKTGRHLIFLLIKLDITHFMSFDKQVYGNGRMPKDKVSNRLLIMEMFPFRTAFSAG